MLFVQIIFITAAANYCTLPNRLLSTIGCWDIVIEQVFTPIKNNEQFDENSHHITFLMYRFIYLFIFLKKWMTE